MRAQQRGGSNFWATRGVSVPDEITAVGGGEKGRGTEKKRWGDNSLSTHNTLSSMRVARPQGSAPLEPSQLGAAGVGARATAHGFGGGRRRVGTSGWPGRRVDRVARGGAVAVVVGHGDVKRGWGGLVCVWLVGSNSRPARRRGRGRPPSSLLLIGRRHASCSTGGRAATPSLQLAGGAGSQASQLGLESGARGGAARIAGLRGHGVTRGRSPPARCCPGNELPVPFKRAVIVDGVGR